MLIYHGSVGENLEVARAEGLKPRGDKPSSWSEEESRNDLVYLTNTYPFFYSRRSGHRLGLAFEIDLEKLDRSLLLPDEDFIAQTQKIVPEEGKSIHATVRDNLEAFSDLWEESLRSLGTCCYKGVIPPAAITRCCVLDVVQRADVWHDLFYVDEIGIEYHAGKGQWHRECLSWAFGDSDRLPTGTRVNPADRRGMEVISFIPQETTPEKEKVDPVKE